MDRSDSADLGDLDSLVELLPTELQKIGRIIFAWAEEEIARRGGAAVHQIQWVRRCVEIACEWGSTSTEEMLGLLLARYYPRESDEAGVPPLNIGMAAHPSVGISLDSNVIAIGVAARRLDYPPARIEFVTVGTLEGFIQRGLHRQFSCLADMGRSCGLAERGDESGLSWPQWTRISLCATIFPEIEADEFLDLCKLLPPTGYYPGRRLSNKTGFKLVFSAVDPMGRSVALKCYQDWESEEMQQLLMRLGMSSRDVIEKDATPDWLGDVRHQHILPCALVRNVEGVPFFVEPLVDSTLDKLADLKANDILRFMREVCNALSYLHTNKHLVHSDIKPDNIGIQNGSAVLLDFGIATVANTSGGRKDNPGSLKTRAPELFSAHANPSPASDIWAVGATLMGLVTEGDYPLIGRDELSKLPPPKDPRRRTIEQKIVDRIHAYRAEPLQLARRIRDAFGEEWSADVVDTVLRACSLDPNQRPSAGELERLLS